MQFWHKGIATILLLFCIFPLRANDSTAISVPRLLLISENTEVNSAYDNSLKEVVAQGLPEVEKAGLVHDLTLSLKEHATSSPDEIAARINALLLSHGFQNAQASVLPELSLSTRLVMVVKFTASPRAASYFTSFSQPLFKEDLRPEVSKNHPMSLSASRENLEAKSDDYLSFLKKKPTSPVQYRAQTSDSFLNDPSTHYEAAWQNPNDPQQSFLYGFTPDPKDSNNVSHSGNTRVQLPWNHTIELNAWQWVSEAKNENIWNLAW